MENHILRLLFEAVSYELSCIAFANTSCVRLATVSDENSRDEKSLK